MPMPILANSRGSGGLPAGIRPCAVVDKRSQLQLIGLGVGRQPMGDAEAPFQRGRHALVPRQLVFPVAPDRGVAADSKLFRRQHGVVGPSQQ